MFLFNLGLFHIILITHDKNQGIAARLNEGIAIAKGEFIACQDADDVSLPQHFAKQIEYLQTYPKVALLGTWYKRKQQPARALHHYHKLQSLQGWKLNTVIKKWYFKTRRYANQQKILHLKHQD